MPLGPGVLDVLVPGVLGALVPGVLDVLAVVAPGVGAGPLVATGPHAQGSGQAPAAAASARVVSTRAR